VRLEKLKLKIADIVIVLQSRFPQEDYSGPDAEHIFTERFKNFIYNGNKKADILINIEIVNELPQPKDTEDIFITRHPQDNSKNWQLLKKGNTHIFRNFVEDKEQVMFMNKAFNRVKAYLLPKKEWGFVWDFTDIVYDFLQVLLIEYFAQRNSGIFIHGVGLKDFNGKGYVFAGKSGAGKSTMAKIWHRRTNATVLNDDRIIIRSFRDKFFIYGSPWHGEFSDYLESRIESAPLKELFFIHHASKNTMRQISSKEAFRRLYPAIFPPFWDKRELENTVSFSTL